jgi:hypothetical protein
MKSQSAVATLAFLIAVSASIGANAATTFNFQFDNSGGGPDGTISPPLVGSGTFVSPIDLGVGQFALSSLPGFSIQFTFGADTFSATDIATPINEVAVLISQFGSQERLVFTENGQGDSGPVGGSLDLVNSVSDAMSFEPTAAGGHTQYVEGSLNNPGPTFIGNYLALSSPVPEPATWAMMLIGFAGLGYGSIRRARKGRHTTAQP